MATSFDVVYKRFLQKITDYTLPEMADEDIAEMFHGWLVTSVAKVRELKIGGFEFDDDKEEFTYTLSNLEIEILALGMTREWLEPQVNSQLLTAQFISSKEQTLTAA